MMKSVQGRLDEFVQYHIHGDGECNNVVLKEYADAHGLTEEERLDLAYFFGVSYCVCTAIVLFQDREEIRRAPREYAGRNKQRLIFQSDRKYVKMLDNFADTLEFWARNLNDAGALLGRLTKDRKVILRKAIPEVEKWTFYGRFSAFLYLETVGWLLGYGVDNYTIDWKHGSTATSGLMNVFGLDDYANEFDKRKRLRVAPEQLDIMLHRVEEKVAEAGGNNDTTQLETSLCAYRKFYKGTRYNGFYLDRMLGECFEYLRRDDTKKIAEEILEIRSKMFDEKYLGEANNWTNIRPKMKKSYLLTGAVL